MKACFVVLYYNHINHTKECVQSIINSSYDKNLIFCFDNGSMPDNNKIIINTFNKVNHNRVENNCGYSGGFNKALDWAFKYGNDYALFCTNDTVISNNILEKLMDFSNKYKSDLICPQINYYNKIGIDSISGYFDKNNFSLQHYHKIDLPMILDKSKDYIPGTCFWISKKIFYELNGMDESYNTYWEDVDFSFRAHEKKIDIYRAFDIEIAHKVGKTCHKKPLYTTFYFQRNRIRFCKKYLSSVDEKKSAKKLINEELNEYFNKHKNDPVRNDYFKKLFIELETL